VCSVVCEDQEAGEETEGIAGGDSVGCNGWVGWGADDLRAVGWGSAAPHVGRYPVSWHRSVGLIRISLMPVPRSIGRLVVGSLFHADTCPACLLAFDALPYLASSLAVHREHLGFVDYSK
jgi:hypothetical protein